MSITFFKLSSSVSAWLIWLANLNFVSFEALPCQRGGIIEIAITLASPFSRFFYFFIVRMKLQQNHLKEHVISTVL
ncbi:hypothetical protein EN01_021620 [Vibrio parahaemolyticus]|nr:hypothetical protein BBM91_13390 [Vibrio parahaemolyticus]OQU13474.1 hypothetical protein EN01_021620 [Vibrio parahaemolyticus]